jgi:hypothetical protein
VPGGGADGDRAAEGEAGHREAVEALGVGRGDELVGEVVDGQWGGGARGVAAAGVVDADDGVAGGETFQDGAVGVGRTAAGAVSEENAGAQIDDDEYTLLFGPVLARLLLERGEVTDKFIDAVVTQWLTTLDLDEVNPRR